jgi:hypothetical protein
MGKRSWQEILDARGYIIVVPCQLDHHVELNVPLSWVVSSNEFHDLPAGSVVPIKETTFADFLGQRKLYRNKTIWCGKKDHYYRCVGE